MNSCLRPAHLILAAACVCQALTASQFAHSQAAPAAAQQAQNAQHMPGNLLIYEGLVQAVGKEDDRIQSEMQAGKAQVAPRTDYAAAIGIDSDQEQALLTILLDAYRKGKEMDIESCPPHSQARFNELALQHGYEEAHSTFGQEDTACSRGHIPILLETWGKLNLLLGKGSFWRLSNYVDRQPWLVTVDQGEPDPNPCPPNDNHPPEQVTHIACSIFYFDYFVDFGTTDQSNRLAESMGREKREFPVPSDLPEDKKQAVIALGLDAAREIKEYYQRFGEAIVQYRKQHNLQIVPYPYPPEVNAVSEKEGVIIEEYIYKLSQALGEDYFKGFDRYLSGKNGTIRIHKAAAAQSPTGALAAQQTMAVQP